MGEEGPVDVIRPDSDGDTIADLDEGSAEETPTDSDGDGTADFEDLDSDADGIDDALEAGDTDVLTLPVDTDLDTVADFRDLESDGNCIDDADEPDEDMDGDAMYARADLDDDGDGLWDLVEMDGCDPVDTDHDSEPDYMDDDSDGDGIRDVYEAGTTDWSTDPADTDQDGTPDFRDQDSDDDGLPDASEGAGDPPADTDGDGTFDFADTDSDGDDLGDRQESNLGTDPYDSDSDGDGFSDGAEYSADSDPSDPNSTIDGLYVTVDERTSIEKSFSFELDIGMADIAFLLDTTCSMSSTLSGISSEFSQLVDDLSVQLPHAEYGVSTFDDYFYGSVGYSGDKPFWLNQQITDDQSAVQGTLSGLGIHNGGDGPESSMEGLYQALTGRGYDQNCNGSYDGTTDVLPFSSTASDPFNGSSQEGDDPSTSGGGDAGGMGFREYALPIVVYTTDNYMRDNDSATYTTPGGCPTDAGANSVANAATNLNAYLIGISVGGSTPVTQMQSLATATGSLADTDGDGAVDDRLVFTWSGSSATLRSTIVDAIQDLVGSIQFESVSLEVQNDPYGFVTDITPDHIDVEGDYAGDLVEFSLTFRGAVAALEEDQVFTITLSVVGDGAILLDTIDVYVVVPGTEI